MAKCPNCQKVETEHQIPRDLTQVIDVPTWKWEDINMYFIVGFPHTHKKNDSIWIIVDRLTRSSHFLPVKSIDLAEEYARLYLDKILSLHVVLFVHHHK